MEKRKFSDGALFGIALIPLIALFVILYFSIIEFGLDPHIPLLISAFVAAIVAQAVLGYKWKDLQDGVMESIGLAMGAMLILLIIGVVIGAWIISGVVPGLIYYGLNIISPKFFLVSALLLTSIIALATGSSWTAAGTIGIALIGMATALDIHIGWTAGAVVSGAYFGDKMSPLSDTTNLAPAIAGTDIFKHIRSMLYTTLPSYIIAAIIYTIVGFMISTDGASSSSTVEATQEVISMSFSIGLWIFIPPIAVIVMILMKVDALPALFISAIIGVVMAIALNGGSAPISDDEATSPSFGDKIGWSMGVMHYGNEADSAGVLEADGYEPIEISVSELEDANLVETAKFYGVYEDGLSPSELVAALENEEVETVTSYEKGDMYVDHLVVNNVDKLLTRGGLDSMLWTVSLIICAMVFGGIMEAAGLLQAVVNMILKLTFNYASVVTASLLTSAFVNVVAADQYLAIVLPGKMYRKSFVEDYKVEPYCFSRVLETGGTLTSALVPWNTCGATMSGFLGVNVWGAGGYAIYAVFNYLSVIVEIIAAAIGFGVVHSDDKESIKQ